MTRVCPNSCLRDERVLPSPNVSHRLPAELLASVFIRIARDSYIDEKYRCIPPRLATAPSWVNVSYVCRYWRDIALNCPTFWSYIPAASQRWMQELLARSQVVPLRIKANLFFRRQEGKPPGVLPIVENMINHSQRVQKLCLNVDIRGSGQDQILSKFLFTRFPCLQHLDIKQLYLPGGESLLLFKENTPALRTLRLTHCSVPWYTLGSSILTTLHLSSVGVFIPENTMTEFLAILRRLPCLVRLSIDGILPDACDFLSSGEFDATPMISLPHLASMSISTAPLSVAVALLSCVDIPLIAKVHLEVVLENISEYPSPLDSDEYARLASLLTQRIRSNSPKFRSLTIGSPRQIAFAFSTSERAGYYDNDSLFSVGSDDDALLKVIFCADLPMDGVDYPALSSICNQIPLTNIQSVHFLGLSLELEFWRDMLVSLSDVRHIRLSQDDMPNITSMLSLPSHHLTIDRQSYTDRGQGEIFAPALEELELYHTTLQRASEQWDPNPYISDLQDLYDAIATRKDTQCRLTIKGCRIISGRVIKTLDSVGWWEGTEFRVTSEV